MKKAVSVFLALILSLSALCVCAYAGGQTSVFVTIADKSGKIVLCREQVSVTDTDSDNAITINDALYCAHEEFYSGGAAAGYGTATGDYGLYINKLWGMLNGTGFGYYVNNISAWSPTDAVKQGDSIYAFIYTDTEKFSDKYSFFESDAAEVTAFEPFEVTLFCYEYDSEWNIKKTPVSGATISVDGKMTKAVTDENGKATVTVTKPGDRLLSAKGNNETLVPPVCVAKAAAQKSFATVITYYFNAIIAFITSLFGSAKK